MSALPGGVFVPFLALGLLGVGAGVAQEAFPHDRHANLFPLCEGCHQVDTGNPANLYPGPEQCAQCHDGTQVAPVDWSSPGGDPGYSHPAHAEATGVALACTDCHGEGGAANVTRLSESCSSCHADHHTADARCRSCHQGPLVAQHEARSHAGCGGSGCHEAEWVAELTFNRELCLLCHQDMEAHKPGRSCGLCHAVGQPRR